MFDIMTRLPMLTWFFHILVSVSLRRNDSGFYNSGSRVTKERKVLTDRVHDTEKGFL